MTIYKGKIEAVCVGPDDVLRKDPRASIDFQLDGIVADRHQGFERETWESGDKYPEGIVCRNERHWTAVSSEELDQISSEMDLEKQLTAETLGANICISGVPELSRLYKGTTLTFPSGATLIVEEYNPACRDMAESIAKSYVTKTGKAPTPTSFLTAAKLSRGVVGIVDVAGQVSVGDEVKVKLYRTPKVLLRSDG